MPSPHGSTFLSVPLGAPQKYRGSFSNLMESVIIVRDYGVSMVSDDTTGSNPIPKNRERVTRLDDIDRDIMKLQDRVSNLGERVTGLETGMLGAIKSVDELKSDFKTLGISLGKSTDERQDKMLNTFYKMFLIFGFISLVSIVAVVTVVGYGMSLKGYGLEIGSASPTSGVGAP